MYDIPAAFGTYKIILDDILHHRSFAGELRPLSTRRSQLLAASFSQYKEHVLLDEIAVYKDIASTPGFIFRFLENKPGFRFADSLVLEAAVDEPLKLISYLDDGKTTVQGKIRGTNNIYVRQIISLSGDRNTRELLPFVIPLAENRITPDSILRARMNVNQYFQLLVNMLTTSSNPGDRSFSFRKLLKDGIRKKAIYFYVSQVNELHSKPDAIRFASVKYLRPEDIYYIITSCGDELYTSSYLGLYKRLMDNFGDQSADSLFTIVGYDNFRNFMRLAANYNVLADFLTKMPGEKAAELLKRFISGIETDTNTGLEKAMDIADAFTGLDSATAIIQMIQQELQTNLVRCRDNRHYYGIRLYSILLQVFDLVQQNNALAELWSTLGNYEMLKRNALQNSNGEIAELVLFYGDKDGAASFNSFQKLFTDAKKWQVMKNDSWITIRSLSDEPVVIYANLPLNSEDESDLKAQDSLTAYLDEQSVEPTILIHRGHSYHLDKTLEKLKPSVRLAILGSCGSYNNAISIANINPDVQIIGSKKMGSMSVNDPLIDVINQALLDKKDLLWPEIWEKLASRFSKDEFTLNLFNEYIPPGKNVSLFVLKLFNSYSKPA